MGKFSLMGSVLFNALTVKKLVTVHWGDCLCLCRDFYGLSSDFPVSQLMTKGEDKTSLFYVSPTLKQLIDCNQTMVNVSMILSLWSVWIWLCCHVYCEYEHVYCEYDSVAMVSVSMILPPWSVWVRFCHHSQCEYDSVTVVNVGMILSSSLSEVWLVMFCAFCFCQSSLLSEYSHYCPVCIFPSVL